MGDVVGLLVGAPLLLKVGAGVVAIASLLWRRERYRPPPPPDWTLPTTEVFIDPETGRRMRVYISPTTGKRVYVEEDPARIEWPPLERPGLILPPQPPQLPPAGEHPGLPPAP